jgi:HAE1 family hydrophobic/amphiphilic exporter-1
LSWLTTLSLRNRSVVALAVVGVIVIGVFAVMSLQEELMPNLNFPYLTILTQEPGASPLDVERGLTTPLEQAVKASGSIKEMTSYSNQGLSIILLQYEFGTDMKAKQAEVQQNLSRAQQMLPAGTQTPSVQILNFSQLPVVQLAVSSSLPPQQLAPLLSGLAVPRLEAISGVEAVTLSGLAQPELRIELDPRQMQRHGITAQQIIAAVQGANLATAAGTVESGGIVYPITVSSTTATVAEFRALVVRPGVTLSGVATVAVARAPETAITRTNGRASVGISVSKSRTGNTVNIADSVRKALPSIRRDLKGQATVTMVQDQSIFITDSISSMWREGLIGALFAVVVIWVFLRNWRSTVIAGLSIPLSVLGALIILFARGNSLNMLTLGGLTIAIGRVIDDSIVVIENAYRHLQEGDDVHTAAFTATREVAGAITASTLTTVAVFLPLGFIHGLSSEFFRPFAWTVTFALLASLLVALTVIPVVVTWLLSKEQVGHREPDEITGLQRVYLPILRLAIGHKTVTLVLALAVFLGVTSFGTLLKTNLFDNSKQNTMSITQQLPAGTSIGVTSSAAAQIEGVLRATPGIKVYQVTVGSTGSLFGPGGGINASSSQAAFMVTTDPARDKNAVLAAVRRRIAGLKRVGTVAVTGEDSSMGGNSDIQVQVTSEDPAPLREANREIFAAMRTIPGLVNLQSSLTSDRPQISIAVDLAKAAAAGIDASLIGRYVTLVTTGYPIGTVPTAAGPLPAELLYPLVQPAMAVTGPGWSLTTLRALPLPSANGVVPLGAVADVRQISAPAQVTHIGGKRAATISATVTSNNIGAASKDVQKALNGVTLPSGAGYTIAGAAQETSDVFRTLGMAMAIAVLLVYIIMVATFRSLLNPLILLVSIPFAAVGAVALLLLTGTSLGMPGMIGLLMLVGIVVTNAIVLLDLVEQFRRRGMDARTAVIEGGRRRLRPILMTAAATILALLPLALGFGNGAFLSAPLAVVVIGGLFTSTLLTLIIVPVLYMAFDRIRGRHAPRAAALADPQSLAS